jgi:DNA helicase-2/ATP-dependent DNA helicase PcrA
MSMRPVLDFEKVLNEEQLEAVTHGEGPQLVLAGAGSGKTRVITHRIAWLVEECGVDPSTITAMTFTNKAAGEMKERVEDLLGMHPLPASVGTFHRFALRLLRIYGDHIRLPRGFAIFDTDDQKRILKRAFASEGLDPKSFRPAAVLAAISGAKNRLLSPDGYEAEADDFFRQRVAGVYRRYQKLLREAGGVDFDDMIALSVALLRKGGEVRRRIRRRARYLLVDEFQDTNQAQLALVLELAGADGNLTAVGDEDQGIYRWRGAELKNILRFEDNFPKAQVRKLERNYRSTQNILDASGAVVANNQDRRGKRLWTEAGAGDAIVLYRAQDEREEARWVLQNLRRQETDYHPSDMAVLVRTNAQTRALEDEFLRQGVSYNLVGGVRFYERAEVKDLIAYLRMVRNPHDGFSMDRVMNRPPRGIGKSTHEQLRKQAADNDKSMWQVLLDDELGSFSARSTKALVRFREILNHLVAEAEGLPLPSLLEQIFDTTDYTKLYSGEDPDSRNRLENIGELLSATKEFAATQGYGTEDDDLLTAFLDHVSLTADTDKLGGKSGASLMTLHSAKGLEFSVVVLAGLEEKILPHMNALHVPDDLEEERRLMYVGMTRARKRLFLTTCRRRQIAGLYQDQEESRFLEEIPQSCLQAEESPQLFRQPSPSLGTSSRTKSDIYSFFGKSSTTAPDMDEVQDFPPDLPVYEPDAPASEKGLRKGSRVLHATLGEGQVFRIDGTGDQKKLTVYFQGSGRRTLVAKYAKLEVL